MCLSALLFPPTPPSSSSGSVATRIPSSSCLPDLFPPTFRKQVCVTGVNYKVVVSEAVEKSLYISSWPSNSTSSLKEDILPGNYISLMGMTPRSTGVSKLRPSAHRTQHTAYPEICEHMTTLGLPISLYFREANLELISKGYRASLKWKDAGDEDLPFPAFQKGRQPQPTGTCQE